MNVSSVPVTLTLDRCHWLLLILRRSCWLNLSIVKILLPCHVTCFIYLLFIYFILYCFYGEKELLWQHVRAAVSAVASQKDGSRLSVRSLYVLLIHGSLWLPPTTQKHAHLVDWSLYRCECACVCWPCCRMGACPGFTLLSPNHSWGRLQPPWLEKRW